MGFGAVGRMLCNPRIVVLAEGLQQQRQPPLEYCLPLCQTHFHWRPYQSHGWLQKAEVILRLYKCNYSLTIKELKLHSALWRQPQGWCDPQWKWVWHPCPVRMNYWFINVDGAQFRQLVDIWSLECCLIGIHGWSLRLKSWHQRRQKPSQPWSVDSMLFAPA